MSQKLFGNIEKLVSLLEQVESLTGELTDGHVTLMRFTTGWKVVFGTPVSLMLVASRDGDKSEHGDLFKKVPAMMDLDTALEYAIKEKPEFFINGRRTGIQPYKRSEPRKKRIPYVPPDKEAAYLQKKGISKELAYSLVLARNKVTCENPLTDEEIKMIVDTVYAPKKKTYKEIVE
jgi:hypothetical protein